MEPASLPLASADPVHPSVHSPSQSPGCPPTKTNLFSLPPGFSNDLDGGKQPLPKLPVEAGLRASIPPGAPPSPLSLRQSQPLSPESVASSMTSVPNADPETLEAAHTLLSLRHPRLFDPQTSTHRQHTPRPLQELLSSSPRPLRPAHSLQFNSKEDPPDPDVYDSEETIDQPINHTMRFPSSTRGDKVVPQSSSRGVNAKSRSSYESYLDASRRDAQIDQHPLAEEFRQKSLIERKGVDADPDAQRIERDMAVTAGFPHGMPADKDGGDRYMGAILDGISRTRIERHGHWPQLAAGEKALDQMRKDVLPNSHEKRPSTLLRQEQSRNRQQTRRSQKEQPGHTANRVSPSDESDAGLNLADDERESGRQLASTEHTPSTSSQASFTLDEPAMELRPSNTAGSEPRKRRKRESDNLATDLGEAWAVHVDPKGGRPKKVPQRDL
ncbi:hypothetical protein JX265_010774 [Neoarthrinium moseri]|uniref:Uncharacterized protein n=1 Tax=Neoarthrinium moseri TaxID=1658444 RepID=A0A9P9WDV6_9PEZI|nr:hypothetical protein JX266_003153 [Neoarthrinium moseri]KAI1858681.1 hypothetical protein JX265_010774 [Neoarthrinium moseri]